MTTESLKKHRDKIEQTILKRSLFGFKEKRKYVNDGKTEPWKSVNDYLLYCRKIDNEHEKAIKRISRDLYEGMKEYEKEIKIIEDLKSNKELYDLYNLINEYE